MKSQRTSTCATCSPADVIEWRGIAVQFGEQLTGGVELQKWKFPLRKMKRTVTILLKLLCRFQNRPAHHRLSAT